jgi:ribosomal protein S18 acetylase RimI-like enzyme
MAALEREMLHVDLDIVIRLATQDDLPKLEWGGEYTHFRRLFTRTFQDQERGTRLMLVADCNGFPVGQIFLHPKNGDGRHKGRRGYLYSLRVMEMFRGLGIGTTLIIAAERYAAETGCGWCTIAVAKDNPRARGLYERLGYQIYGDESGNWHFLDHRGRIRRVHEPCWVLEKLLDRG